MKEGYKKTKIKGIVLPNEHGSWGILAEPLVAAIAVAPSLPGFAVILFFVGAFLVRQPLRVFITDTLNGIKQPRTILASKSVLAFSFLAVLGFLGSVAFGDIKDYFAASLVIPFGAYQIYADVGRKSRQLIPELTGTVAISSSAPVIAIAGGWGYPEALALWFIMCARLIPSILYVRSRLRLEKGKQYSLAPVLVTNFVAFLAVSVMAAIGIASFLTAVVFALLTLRSVLGLSSFRTKMKAMKIGIWETVYGLLTVISVIVGYYMNI